MKSRYIMRLPEVILTTGYSRSSIYILMRNGSFPKSRALGVRAVGWDSSEIHAWVSARLDLV